MIPAKATLQWVEQFVIRHGLCPFAALPFREGRVAAVTSEVEGDEACFYWALAQVQGLLETEPGDTETTLLVFPRQFPEFEHFLDFVYAVEDALAETGAAELVQLAHFHPDYRFAGVPEEDPGNRTNRAPFAVLQLLRTGSVAAAVAVHPDVEGIPERNVARMREVFGN